MTESFISIDLNDERAKYISEILGNESCKKILNLLAEKELTETEISTTLKLPLNTVDYNIKKLSKAGLIESTQHWWSARGKKMPAYKISNKKIVISPKSFTAKTALLATLAIDTFFSFIVRHLTKPANITKDLIENVSSKTLATASYQTAERCIDGPIGSSCGEAFVENVSFFSSLSGWEWFLIGAWLSTILFFILTKINGRLNK